MEKFNKVLFISNGVLGTKPGVTGGEMRLVEIAKQWQKKGYEIHLMSTKPGKTFFKNLGLKFIFHQSIDLKQCNRFNLSLLFLRSPFFVKSIKNLNDCIVYSTNDLLLDVIPAFTLKLIKRKKIKWVGIVHWLPPFPPWKRKGPSLFDSTLFFINQRLSLLLYKLLADKVLAVSNSTRKQLNNTFLKINDKRIGTVECGIDCEKIESIINNVTNKPYDAVFMKRFQPSKGVFDLLDIWTEVVKSIPNAKLLLIGNGDGPFEVVMKKIIKERGLKDNIIFAGIIYNLKEKFEKIAQGKVFILPSYEENWAIVIGEAMMAKLPVLAYDLKELKQVWEDKFIPIPLGDTKIFAQQIIELLRSDKKIKSLSLKAFKFAKKYDWKNVADKEIKLVLKSF